MAVVVVVGVDARFVAVVPIFVSRSVNTCIVGKVYEFSDVEKWYSNSLSNLIIFTMLSSFFSSAISDLL